MSKVFVGLSGGVDSGTSAALLLEQGHDVTGVFIKIWQPEFIECTWREDRLDAMRVAAALNIPFREIDLSHEYKEEVVRTMIEDYSRGVTPNPDVLCNEKIKFGVFIKWALSEGAEAVATGHYAQIENRNGKYVLCRGADASKDQSYFVHRLRGVDLERILFPVGGVLKSDVRVQAQRFDLPVAYKHDSQGLCFVGEVSLADFLKRYITVTGGAVLNSSGEVIGTHEGAALYTIGQRHGFVLQGAPYTTPHYVTAIDTEENTITVSDNRMDAARQTVYLEDVHWIHRRATTPQSLEVQTRYHEKPVQVTLHEEGNRLRAEFKEPHVVSPGQSMVFYEGDVCLGGAIISK